jgi:hypothetical protein
MKAAAIYAAKKWFYSEERKFHVKATAVFYGYKKSPKVFEQLTACPTK